MFPYKIQHDTAPPAGVWLSKPGNCSHVEHHGCHWTYLCMHTCIKGKVKSDLVFQILYIFQDLKKTEWGGLPVSCSLVANYDPSASVSTSWGGSCVPLTGPTRHWGCLSVVHRQLLSCSPQDLHRARKQALDRQSHLDRGRLPLLLWSCTPVSPAVF